MAESSVAIRRIDSEYRIPSDHPEPYALRDRLDGILRSHVNTSLASELRHGISASDESLLFIRNIDVDITLNADWSDREIADVWAEAIARNIAPSLSRRTTGEDSAWFASRVAYLAEYIRQTAAGTAVNRWYFRAFEGLRLLSASAAIRTGIGRNPSDGLASLHALSRRDLEATLAVMSRADIRRTLELLYTGGAAASDALARAIVHTWKSGLILPAAIAEDEPGCAMQLCIEVTRGRARLAGEALVFAAYALVRLSRLLQTRELPLVRQAVRSGKVGTLYLTAGVSDAEIIAPICSWPVDLRFEVTRRQDEHFASGFQGEPRAEDSGASPPADGSSHADTPPVTTAAEPGTGGAAADIDLKRTTLPGVEGSRVQPELNRLPAEPYAANAVLQTSFGGIFLLLPSLDAILPSELLHGWPTSENCSAAAMLRLLVISRCFGRSRTLAALGDPAMQQLVGAHRIPLHELFEWQTGIKPRMWRELAHQVALRVAGLNSNHAVLIGSIGTRGGKTAIAIECSRGFWLRAVSYRQDRCAAPAAQIADSLEAAQLIVVQDPCIASALAGAGFAGQVAAIGENIPGEHSAGAAMADQVARINRLPDDLRYLAGQPSNLLAHSADLTVRVLAHNVMRLFAARLPGFALSSLDHLNANFLAFSATAEFETTGRVVVRTGRPPLHLILSLTGISRASYRLSWMPESLIALYPEA